MMISAVLEAASGSKKSLGVRDGNYHGAKQRQEPKKMITLSPSQRFYGGTIKSKTNHHAAAPSRLLFRGRASAEKRRSMLERISRSLSPSSPSSKDKNKQEKRSKTKKKITSPSPAGDGKKNKQSITDDSAGVDTYLQELDNFVQNQQKEAARAVVAKHVFANKHNANVNDNAPVSSTTNSSNNNETTLNSVILPPPTTTPKKPSKKSVSRSSKAATSVLDDAYMEQLDEFLQDQQHQTDAKPEKAVLKGIEASTPPRKTTSRATSFFHKKHRRDAPLAIRSSPPMRRKPCEEIVIPVHFSSPSSSSYSSHSTPPLRPPPPPSLAPDGSSSTSVPKAATVSKHSKDSQLSLIEDEIEKLEREKQLIDWKLQNLQGVTNDLQSVPNTATTVCSDITFDHDQMSPPPTEKETILQQQQQQREIRYLRNQLEGRDRATELHALKTRILQVASIRAQQAQEQIRTDQNRNEDERITTAHEKDDSDVQDAAAAAAAAVSS